MQVTKFIGAGGLMWNRFLPFLGWASDINRQTLRADLVAGLTVALVLIPQSMAYAQLASLPAYYGLYAAFLPPMIAALFGSSRQLATGPVAVVSLLTAAALEPLATAGSEAYIAYAVLLAFVVGMFQLLLGLLRLGVVVNFLSHPVINGFTNAAAIIIATSQLSKIFGVYVDKAEHQYETVWRVIVAAMHFTHWPTLGLAALAFAIMYALKMVNPRIPFVLVAVAITTMISWATGFEHNERVPIAHVHSEAVRHKIDEFNSTINAIETTSQERAQLSHRVIDAAERFGKRSTEYFDLTHRLDLWNLRLGYLKARASQVREQFRSLYFSEVRQSDQSAFYLDGEAPAGEAKDGRHWRLEVSNARLDTDSLEFTGGGAVVGEVPRGLPEIKAPDMDIKTILRFLPMAAIISLLGFMEAISIAKAMAVRTGQRLDVNQELIGQGLANVFGAFTRSYPVSGSFSRSALNAGAGAVTGLSSVFTGLVVVVTLIFLTPLLHYIPQSVLAAVIMSAVIGLINAKGFIHAYRAQRYDGIIAVVTFVATLAFAPHLDRGIMIGVVLSVGHYLYRNMKPKLARLSLHPDHSLRDAERHGLRECPHIAVIQFEGPLFFANSNYLEDQIADRLETMPQLRHIHLVGNSVSEIDASGEETLSLLVDRLGERGIDISLSGLNENVLDTMRRTHLYEKIGEGNIYPTQLMAIQAIHEKSHRGSSEEACPLLEVCYFDPDKVPDGKLLVNDFEMLLVDDEKDFVMYMTKRLRRKGLNVSACTDPREALRKMEEKSYEVVVLDLKMPGLSGQEFLEEVHSRHPQSQVIMLTGHGTSHKAFQLAKAGAFEYLAKPCPIEDLIHAINRAVIVGRSRAGNRKSA
jgi:MFS superfamily sulfate permease-like transporter/ActR/RegA family two-component response regulator